MPASLADLLFYETLPDETRRIIERVWAMRGIDVSEEKIRDAFSEGHAEGYDEGFEDGKDAGIEEANTRIADELCEKCGSDVSACFQCGTKEVSHA